MDTLSKPETRVGRRWLLIVPPSAWLVFVVLHRVLSGRVWWWGALELVPPFMFLLVPVLGLGLAALARPVRWRVATLAVVSLALGASLGGLNPATLWHRPPTAAHAINVFSWNTWYWDQPGDTGATEPPPGGTAAATVDGFYQYLRDQNADIYLLQEYLYLHDDIPVPVNDEARLRANFPGYRIAAAGELVTLSRLPVVGVQRLSLLPYLPAGRDLDMPGGPELQDFYTDKLLRTDIDVRGQIVSFYNAHIPTPVELNPSSFRPAPMSEAHDTRQATLRALAADLAGNLRPALLSGDFNTSPAMGLLQMVPDRLRDVTSALRSVYPTSWDDRSLRLWRIDWVFVTPEVTVNRYRLISSRGQSDHRGQSLVLSLSTHS